MSYKSLSPDLNRGLGTAPTHIFIEVDTQYFSLHLELSAVNI